ncbi:M28 family peptidase [Nostoc sp. UHCC 0702]|nr:M28 family peptidase [Nostoc sp. UHCC 0702]
MFWKKKYRTRQFILVLTIILIITVGLQVFNIGQSEGLGSVNRVRQEAIKIKKSLPDYPQEIQIPSNRAIYSWIKQISSWPHRRPGTPEGHEAEDWVKTEFQRIGLENVSEERVKIPVWIPKKWSLQVGGENIPSYFILNTEFTNAKGVSAPLVYVGKGGASDFKKVNASGKIVVVDAQISSTGKKATRLDKAFFVSDPRQHLTDKVYEVHFPSNMLGGFAPGYEDADNFLERALEKQDAYRNALKAKAIGMIIILKGYCGEYNSFYGPYDGAMKQIPGLYVSNNQGEKLRRLAKQGEQANLVLTGSVTNGYMKNIWGTLPGNSPRTILVTSHHDSAHQGAVEDGSGMAQVLAQAQAWARVPQSRRPKTLIFVAAAGHFFKGQGAYHFGKNHPDILNNTDVVITLEHMGAKEVKPDGRGKYIQTSRPQFSMINTSMDANMVAAVWKAFDKNSQLSTVCTNPPFDFPLTDTAGFISSTRERKYKRKGGVRYISWISAPCYLVDEEDTLDKIDQSRLQSLALTVNEMIKNLMVMEK